MRITIINGSPKGQYSITLQSCLYLQKQHPEHEWNILHVGQKIHQLEKDFTPAREALNAADLILFSYPVYTFIAPSQLHRFIELMKAEVTAGQLSVSGKWMTQITTSKHFYDITAHRYVEENGRDLGLRLLPGLSADMDDLLTDKGRRELASFFDYKMFEMSAPNLESCAVKDNSRTVAIVADLGDDSPALAEMVDRFRALMPYNSKLVNIREFPFKGGCISCFNCSTDGQCFYPDHFDTFLREEIQTCDAIIYAFAIRDHSMGARFKMYDDRQFCNGHRTVTMGAPTGYLVSGAYSQEANLQMILEGRANVGGNYFCGVATDEHIEDPVHREMTVEQLATRLTYALQHRYQQPANFLGVGGMKIFRDLIYLMQGMMRADHKFFKSHGQYDFPQKKRGTILKMYLVGWLMKNKKLRSKMGSKMNDGMIKPYKEAIEKKKSSSAQRTGLHSPLLTLLLTICLSFLTIACHNGRDTENPINNPTTVRLTGGDSVANFNDKDSDQCTFKSNRDTNQYKKALCHLKELVVAGADIPAKVLYEATPRSESEYSIWYRLAECEWRDKGNTSIVDLEYLLRQYAEADSTDIMEAIMLFGEFTDGYVSDAVGDDYIALEKKYPAKFSALRKKRSEFWNENHDEWKKVMSE